MLKLFFVLICIVSFYTAYNQPHADVVIAFGSCSRQSEQEQLWAEVLKQKPKLWVWGGDNIYGDSHDINVLKQKYDQQKHHPDYQKLLNACAVTGTWDDHDYGVNDGGKYFSKKDESKKLLLSFLGIGQNHPVHKHEGVYHSYVLGKGKQKIKVLNLDTRYFRDTLRREFYYDESLKDSVSRYKQNLNGDILGEAQWQWLEHELKNSDASLHIINSSIQVISAEHRFEKWANFPTARKRLLELLKKYSHKGILIISGDRHIAEFSQLQQNGDNYPLVDFTSSGLTHTWNVKSNDGSTPVETNRHRINDMVIQKNFGIIRLNWRRHSINVIMEIRGRNDQLFHSHSIDIPKA
ncbi:alkaline phosphatase D family protein [Chryseosolibacter indicus]|uniref:Alkaline phosphatase family protein n=1 Tax=Chryseosolibacter indicus TaxID=2782351 RepID=A0ABS5VM38_9BACT|nr:alkaline phosphatase D family protein [Chryseosolibacter indicus]MBT1702523.1 alkaline phosphatase family protein [Chryseosolibacter indicus]